MGSPGWLPVQTKAPAVQPTPAPQPYSSGPGLQAGQAQPQLSSLNQSGPGQGESYYDANKSVYQSPSYGEVNTQGIVNNYSDPNNRPGVTNNSQNWFQHYAGSIPSIASDPGLDPYYNNAERRSTEGINQAVAARGAYGSSAANDQISRGITDLEADKAQHEAQYNLQRLGEQRAWEGLGGQMAGQADQSSQAQSQDQQHWADLLSRLGIDASQLGLSRTNAGADAANNAQGLTRSRGNDYFNQQMASGDRLSDLIKSIMLPGLDNDAAMMSDASSGNIAQGNAVAANEQTNSQNTMNAMSSGANLYSQIYGGGH